MLQSDLKNQLIIMLKKGHSINSISQELGLGKSTIYYHYNKINGRKYKKLNLKPGYSFTEGEIVGIFAGDGSQYVQKDQYSYRTNIHFGNKNRDYALYVQQLFLNYFKKKFTLQKQTEHGIRLATTSKEIYNFFHHYLEFNPKLKHFTVKFKRINLPFDFLAGFLKGYLDTDGCIYKRKNTSILRVSYKTTSLGLASQTIMICSKLGVTSSLYHKRSKNINEKDSFTVQIWKRSTDNFLNLTKPHKMKRMGASNSAR